VSLEDRLMRHHALQPFRLNRAASLFTGSTGASASSNGASSRRLRVSAAVVKLASQLIAQGHQFASRVHNSPLLTPPQPAGQVDMSCARASRTAATYRALASGHGGGRGGLCSGRARAPPRRPPGFTAIVPRVASYFPAQN
jgi:hypothetical protein